MIAVPDTLLTNTDEVEAVADLKVVLAHARPRLKSYLEQASALGGEVATVANIAMCKADLEQQRRGSVFSADGYPGDQAIRWIATGLAALGSSRQLNDFNPLRVHSSVEERSGAAKPDADMGDPGDGADSKSPIALVLVKVRLAFRTLMVACARMVLDEDKGGPISGGTDKVGPGIMAMGGSHKRRDATCFEVERAFESFRDGCSGMNGQEVLGAFRSFWRLLQETVSGSAGWMPPTCTASRLPAEPGPRCSGTQLPPPATQLGSCRPG